MKKLEMIMCSLWRAIYIKHKNSACLLADITFIVMLFLFKIEYIKQITNYNSVSVCEDETTAWQWWHDNFNPNKDDCCNLDK